MSLSLSFWKDPKCRIAGLVFLFVPTSFIPSNAHTLPYPIYIKKPFPDVLLGGWFLSQDPVRRWEHCQSDLYYLSEIQSCNSATSKSSIFSVWWEINPFLDMLVLTAVNCPFRAKFYEYLKTENIFLKTAVQSLFPPIFVPDSTRTGAIVCMVGRYPIKAQAEILDTRTWLCDHLLRF